MILKYFFVTRKDGVNLFISLDGIKQEDGTIIPTGLKIRKKGTDELYDVAIDVEGAPFFYEETDVPIDSEPEELYDVAVDVEGAPFDYEETDKPIGLSDGEEN